MNKFFKLLLAALIVFVTFYFNYPFPHPYSVYVGDSDVDITIPAPTTGLVGLNEVDYGGIDLETVDKDIYEAFNGWLGIRGLLKNDFYSINLYYSRVNDYGQLQRGLVGEIGNISKEEIKKYKSAKYFDEVSNMISQARIHCHYPSSFEDFSGPSVFVIICLVLLTLFVWVCALDWE